MALVRRTPSACRIRRGGHSSQAEPQSSQQLGSVDIGLTHEKPASKPRQTRIILLGVFRLHRPATRRRIAGCLAQFQESTRRTMRLRGSYGDVFLAGGDVGLQHRDQLVPGRGPGRGRRDGRLRRCWITGHQCFGADPSRGWRFSSSFTITGSPGAFVDLGESSLGIDSGSQTISVPLKELGGLYKFGTGTLTSRERIATTRSSQSSTGVQLLSGRTRPSAPGCSISRAARRCWRRLTGSPSPTPSTLRDKEQPSSTPKQTTSPFRARSRILQPVFLLQVSWQSLALAR